MHFFFSRFFGENESLCLWIFQAPKMYMARTVERNEEIRKVKKRIHNGIDGGAKCLAIWNNLLVHFVIEKVCNEIRWHQDTANKQLKQAVIRFQFGQWLRSIFNWQLIIDNWKHLFLYSRVRRLAEKRIAWSTYSIYYRHSIYVCTEYIVPSNNSNGTEETATSMWNEWLANFDCQSIELITFG